MSIPIEKTQELLIIDEGGQIILYMNDQNPDSDDQPDRTIMTASYLTAILQFAKAATKGTIISSFEMGKTRLYLKVGDLLPVYYVFIAGKNIRLREKKIKQRLQNVADEFENRFALYDLKEWDGSTDFFKIFRKPAKKILHF